MSLKFLISAALLVLGGCGSSDTPEKTIAAPEEALEGTPLNPAHLASKDAERVCKAAIGLAMSHDPEIMSVAQHSAEFIRVKYVRDDDHKVWKYDCQVRGNSVVYRTVDAFGPKTGPGAWRNRPGDEVLTFRATDKQVVIYERYQDGSSTGQIYWI